MIFSLYLNRFPRAHFEPLQNIWIDQTFSETVSEIQYFAKTQFLYLTKINYKNTATTATKDMEMTDRNIGCFYIKNRKDGDAYEGIKRLIGWLKEIVCPIV